MGEREREWEVTSLDYQKREEGKQERNRERERESERIMFNR